MEASPFNFVSLRPALDFLRFDRISETFRIEAVLAAVCGFRLRIHEISDLRPTRLRQFYIVGIIIGQPIHFPCAEKFGAVSPKRNAMVIILPEET